MHGRHYAVHRRARASTGPRVERRRPPRIEEVPAVKTLSVASHPKETRERGETQFERDFRKRRRLDMCAAVGVAFVSDNPDNQKIKLGPRTRRRYYLGETSTTSFRSRRVGSGKIHFRDLWLRWLVRSTVTGDGRTGFAQNDALTAVGLRLTRVPHKDDCTVVANIK